MFAIIAVLLSIRLVSATADIRILGHGLAPVNMIIPTLVVFILVLGLALAQFTPKSAGVARAILYSAVYVVIALAAVVALGYLRVSLLVFGPRGIPSFVEYSAKLVLPLHVVVIVALWTVARALARWLPTPVCTSCLSNKQLLSGQGADIADIRAAIADVRSVTAETEARISQKEDEVEDAICAARSHRETTVAELKAKLATSEAKALSARQNINIRVEELEHVVNPGRKEAQDVETIIAGQNDGIKAHAEKTKELITVNKVRVKRLERNLSALKLKTARETERTSLAKRQAAELKDKAELLVATAERQARELEQKDRMLESLCEWIAERKLISTAAAITADVVEAQDVEVLAADLKACNTECMDLSVQRDRLMAAYRESFLDVTELQELFEPAGVDVSDEDLPDPAVT